MSALLNPRSMSNVELASELLAVVSGDADRKPTAEERYGLIYEAVLRLRGDQR